MKVGIFGVGLLGGSVALGLRGRLLAREIHAYDPAPLALEAAQALGVADVVHPSLGPWIGELDVAVLAAPTGALPALGQAVAAFAGPRTLWIDVGSVKAPVVDALEAALPRFVGTHPMAGSERAGVEHATAGLLENAVWVLTPTDRTPPDALDRATALVTELGAYPLRLDPALHDALVARVSHVPYLLAVALNLLVARDPHRDHLMFLAAGGFRDLTRVASGAPTMSRDMVVHNRAAVRQALGDLRALLGELEARLSDPEALLALAEDAKATRDALPVVRRALLPRLYDVVLAVPDRPGELARLTGALAEARVNIRDIEVLTIRDGRESIRIGFSSGEDRDAGRRALADAGYLVR